MTDGQFALKRCQGSVVEDVGHQPHLLGDRKVLAVTDRHACGFLPTVLQGIQPQVGEVCDCPTRCPNSKNAAGFLRPVVIRVGDHSGRFRRLSALKTSDAQVRG